MTSDHRKVNEWLQKDYQTGEYWKNVGKEIYLVANGDCALTRHRLADVLRRSISKLQPGPVTYQKWKDDFSEIEKVEIESPNISATNDAYVDWLRLADFLLLAAASTWPRLEEENMRRRAMYDQARRGYEARMIVKEIAEYLKEHPTVTDGDIQATLNKPNREVAQIHIAKAKQLIPHTAGREISEREPEEPSPLNRYTPLYF